MRLNLHPIASLIGVSICIGCSSNSPPVASSQSARLPDSLPIVDLSPGRSSEFLEAYVGKRVTVRGYWSGMGKQSAFIDAENRAGEIIYVRSTTEKGLEKENQTQAPEHTPVEVTGVLRLYQAPPSPKPSTSPTAPTSQTAPTHFYFDVEHSQVVFRRK